MCVPSVFIRDDGKGFVVRRAGIDFDVRPGPYKGFVTTNGKAIYEGGVIGKGETIMEAVDSALAKVKDRE
jgi:hypothetical protein